MATSVEDMRSKCRLFVIDFLNKAAIDKLGEYLAPDGMSHSAPPGTKGDFEGTKQFFTHLFQAFPDARWSVDDVICEGDKAVMRTTMRGTHKGEFMGIRATEKYVQVTGIDIIRFRDGMMVEHWGNQDDLGMMQQIGVVPSQ